MDFITKVSVISDGPLIYEFCSFNHPRHSISRESGRTRSSLIIEMMFSESFFFISTDSEIDSSFRTDQINFHRLFMSLCGGEGNNNFYTFKMSGLEYILRRNRLYALLCVECILTNFRLNKRFKNTVEPLFDYIYNYR